MNQDIDIDYDAALEGQNARAEGRPITDNPHIEGLEDAEFFGWKWGWENPE